MINDNAGRQLRLEVNWILSGLHLDSCMKRLLLGTSTWQLMGQIVTADTFLVPILNVGLDALLRHRFRTV
jgi:hypothetical protein